MPEWTEAMSKAYWEGSAAYLGGKRIDDNPYQGQEYARCWTLGWMVESENLEARDTG